MDEVPSGSVPRAPGLWGSLSEERSRGSSVAQPFSFVSIHLIQSETTQHAKLKLAGKKGESE